MLFEDISNVPHIMNLYRRFSISLDNKRIYLITRLKSVDRRWIRKCAQTTKLVIIFLLQTIAFYSSCDMNIQLRVFVTVKSHKSQPNRLEIIDKLLIDIQIAQVINNLDLHY